MFESNESITDRIKNIFPNAKADNKFFGYEYYEDPQKEYNSLINGVGVRKAEERSLIKLDGPDSLEFLHRITTNSLKELEKFSCRSSIFTTEKGRILDLVEVMNFGDFVLLLCSKNHRDKVIGWIKKYIIMEDIKVSAAEEEFSIFEIYGPQSDSYLSMILTLQEKEDKTNEIFKGDIEGSLVYMAKTKEQGIDKKILLSGSSDVEKIIKIFYENKSAYDFSFVGNLAYDNFRIERGVLKSPNEINDQYNPNETGLLDYVSFTKGCYIGQEVIARLDTYDKTQREVKGAKVNGDFKEPDLPVEVFDASGQEAGKITSLIRSLKGNDFIGIALIRKKFIGEENLFVSDNNNKIKISLTTFPIDN